MHGFLGRGIITLNALDIPHVMVRSWHVQGHSIDAGCKDPEGSLQPQMLPLIGKQRDIYVYLLVIIVSRRIWLMLTLIHIFYVYLTLPIVVEFYSLKG